MAHDDLRNAWRVSVVSVVWTVVTGSAAIAVGVANQSAVLVAFGAVGFVDALGSVALAHHFRHGLRHDAMADHLEQLVHQVVNIGLCAVGVAAVVLGAVRLAGDHSHDASVTGIVLAAVSLLVLLVLANAKRVLASRVRSPALRSDGQLSMVGAAQAAVTLLGVAAAAVGWWWADPGAAIMIGVVATLLGLSSLRAQRRSIVAGA